MQGHGTYKTLSNALNIVDPVHNFCFCYTMNLSKVKICVKGTGMNTHSTLRHPKFIFILFGYYKIMVS
jgi:hypothetical protein